MDKSLRNTLRNTVTHCRRLLEDAIAELLQGQFGIHLDGKIENAGSLSHLSEEDREYRAQILVHLQHIQAGGHTPSGAPKGGGSGGAVAKKSSGPPTFQPSKETVAQLIREVAFTHLNRLAAYKMMETRGLIRESVSRGVKSQGFLFYLADHPEDEKLWSSGQQERAYRHFLTWLGGTLSQEIGVLFSPDDPANRLLPPQRVLDGVLDLLNSADLAAIWAEDETIGWIYQYFTPKELRDQARSESQAPRNSYELAFRNQFYTPRYVVQFLTDNTLGRIWYEMTRGETTLTEKCQYLVRRPNEVFLTADQRPPTAEANGESANGESEKSKIQNPKSKIQTLVYVPYRKKKDPRDLKILDPASGSGHFLLYCFDLLEIIYGEAYADPDLGPALQADYSTLADLRQAIPALILRHNLHGIDIDPRAVQIASLALWLRAKKRPGETANQRMANGESSPHASRITHHAATGTQASRITKMNIVCAEPMPGNAALLDEFTADLQPPLLGQLLRAIVGKMELAGEAGSLLKIEEEIDDALAAAKKQWLAGPKPEQLSFFPQEKTPEQLNMFDLTGISDEQFWEEAEGRLLAALRDYAEHASGEAGLARRLFADDTARSFAFIDLCRQCFDIVLMNPPFGEASRFSKNYIEKTYPNTKNDVFAVCIERWLDRLFKNGLLGAITSRTGFFLVSFQKWREEILLKKYNPTVCADLGQGVLEAMVETAAYCLSSNQYQDTQFFRLLDSENKGQNLVQAINDLYRGLSNTVIYNINSESFKRVPGSPFAYWVTERIQRLFNEFSQFESQERTVKQGLATAEDFRFVRTWWEINSEKVATSEIDISPEAFRQQTFQGKRWIPFAKGGSHSPYYSGLHLVVDWECNGENIKTRINPVSNRPYSNVWQLKATENQYFFRPGLTWPIKNRFTFKPWPLPVGCIFAHVGAAGFVPRPHELPRYHGLLSSSIFTSLLRLTAGWNFEVGVIRRTPVPDLSGSDGIRLGKLASTCVDLKRDLDRSEETSYAFHLPALLQTNGNTLVERSNNWTVQVSEIIKRIETYQYQIDDIAFHLYDVDDVDRRTIEKSLSNQSEDTDIDDNESDNDDVNSESPISVEISILIKAFLAYNVGCSFGRWDIRLALDSTLVPTLQGPFDPLPSCSPGILVGPNGLPASSRYIVSEEWLRARPNAISLPPEGSVSRPTIPDSEYPVAVDWDGILVDDPDHPDDLLRRVREVFELLWSDQAEAIEHEANEILGIKDLRAYFRNSGKGGFWLDHVKRYSKSRRKAPIYWLLQSSRKNYALWLYYHRLDKDILYKALVNTVEPKIRLEESKLEGIRGQLPGAGGQGSGAGGRSQKVLEKELDQQESFVAELHDFRDKLRRAAQLNLEPDLNDGVVLNVAPLWELVPWKEARQYWEELLAGKYEWSSVGRQLRKKGLVK